MTADNLSSSISIDGGARPFWIAIIIVLTMAIPSLGYIFGAGSMAAGIFVSACGLIALTLFGGGHWQTWRGGEGAMVMSIWLTVIVAASISQTLLLHSVVNAARAINSMLLFITTVGAALIIARNADNISQLYLKKVINIIFIILSVAGIFGVFHYSPFTDRAAKAVLFFNEPSHYSLSFSPFLLCSIIFAKARYRIALIVFGIILGLLLESLTLLAAILLISLVTLRARYVIRLSPILIIIFTNLTLDYYATRLDFSSDATNYSTLVFLSGWERAYLAIQETSGLGVGFQQFGVIGGQGEISALIGSLLGSRLSVLDGGTVGAKFIGEFGITAAILISIYFIVFVRLFCALRAASLAPDECIKDTRFILAASIFTMYSIDLFIRGVAYFSPSSFLFAAACLWLAAARSRARNNNVRLSARQ